MRFNSLLRLFFIVYCTEAGFFLFFGPWSRGWDRTVLLIPVPAVRHLFLHPLLRGAVSGFGLVHLVWSMHDLVDSVTRRVGVDGGRA